MNTLFVFPGQGSQYESMGGGLYEIEPVVCDALHRCEVEFADATGESLLEVVYPEEERDGTKREMRRRMKEGASKETD